LLTTPQTLQTTDPAALASYSGYACLQAKDGTVGVPAECQATGASSVLAQYSQCGQSTEAVVQSILNVTNTGACETVLIGPLSVYCNATFGAAIQSFCTPTFCQQAFPGSNSLSMCAGIGVVVGVLVGVGALGGLAAFVAYRRQKERKRKEGLMYISPPSPNGNAFSPQMSKQSSFGALVPPPPMGNTWGSQSPMYAQSPVVQAPMSNRMMMPPPMSSQAPGLSASSPIPASQALDPATLTIRKGQLCDFYLFHDPTRENIPEHVDKLFDKYSFENILAAVRSKYGVAPQGWQA
jgi:hypothetical protein